MKVALVQLVSQSRDVQANQAEADKLLASRKSALLNEGVDLIVLPELSFQPYLIANAASAIVDADLTLQWAAKTAKAHGAGVCVGCVREQQGKLYNSLLIVDPQGNLIATRDKHFLYVSDKAWAEPGCPFAKVTLPWMGVDAMFAVCNDINGLTFDAEDMDKRALAHACAAQGVKLIVLSTAWCSAAPQDAAFLHDAPVNGAHIVEYWLSRLEPLIGSPIFFVAADRVGREAIPPGFNARIHYCGTSCAISLREPRMCAAPLPTDQAGVAVVTLR